MKGTQPYKQITAIILLAAINLHIFSSPIIVADFFINTHDYTLQCENKAAPQLNCKGRCQMIKRLQLEKKLNAEKQDCRTENANEVLLSSKSFFATVVIPATRIISIEKVTCYLPGISTNPDFDIFHPPRFA